jgi:hypothetical protein
MDITTNEVCKVWQMYFEKNVDMSNTGARWHFSSRQLQYFFYLDINFLRDLSFPSTYAMWWWRVAVILLLLDAEYVLDFKSYYFVESKNVLSW